MSKAKFSLRRYDSQALMSMLLSFAAFAPIAAMAAFILKKMNTDDWVMYYGPRGRVGVFVCALCAMGLATLGVGFGYNSAGQRRNERARWSWIGFFAGALAISLAAILLLLFKLRGESALG